MVNIPTHRPPTHPGEVLLEEFLKPSELSQQTLADAIGVSFQRINELCNQRRGITPSTALRLSRFFGTTPDFWLNLQLRCELYAAIQKDSEVLQRIQPLSSTQCHDLN
jgi:antitoxin HigA-1